MRTAFVDTLLELAREDDRIVLVVGDLGFGVVTAFADELPNQFVNAGVAEQNMTGMAAGMALSGKIVFTYSIGNFPTLRCLEQIRNDVCYHGANVKVVCVGGGMTYGSLGASHHAIEDLAIMRAIPGLVVVAPGDPLEARLATRAVAAHDGPCYLRLGRAGETVVHASEPEFELGKSIELRDGDDLTLVSTGGMLPLVMAAAELLENEGVQARVLSMPTLKPLDEEAIRRAARQTPVMITVEEHRVSGGLGGAVAEVLLESNVRPRAFKRIGLADDFFSEVGSQEHLRTYSGLDVDGIMQTISSTLEQIET